MLVLASLRGRKEGKLEVVIPLVGSGQLFLLREHRMAENELFFSFMDSH